MGASHGRSEGGEMIYILVGVPASGKTWVCNRIKGMTVVRNDDYMGDRSGYVQAIKEASKGDKPVLCEAPFAASQLIEMLHSINKPIKQVLVTGPIEEIENRYKERKNGQPFRAAFKTNHRRYEEDPDRFEFSGTSEEVLKWLEGDKNGTET